MQTNDSAAEILLLGPASVRRGDATCPITGREERIVLSVLVISLGRPVPIGALVEAIWRDEPPPSAVNVIQSVVSRLRNLLPGASVENVDGSYVLSADPAAIDVCRFEAAVARAERELHDDPQVARNAVLEALESWRGDPYLDLADDPDVMLEIHRMTELRSRAMELFWEAELLLGHHERIIPALEAAAGTHPYRERVWYLLITALARAGRRVEALRAYDRVAHLLAEVGMEPTADLQGLPGRVLRDDPDVRPVFREPFESAG